MMDTIISADEVQVSPRGRTAVYDDALLAVFKNLKEDQAVVLDESFGKVPHKDRSTVSSKIRKHWAEVRDDSVSINYSPEGIPQVRVRNRSARVLSL